MSRHGAPGGCGGLFATAAIRRAPEAPGAKLSAAGTGADSPCPVAVDPTLPVSYFCLLTAYYLPPGPKLVRASLLDPWP
ncbi:MAG: hypothetical protein FRX49_07460 [Trebouxia sp. A1-2]|nr:MAG: hypothetical protein FRX49_07460 [Trebouxia sp. A1-2]